jgi:UDP-2-acetamido-2,6-beta-L-arabino-hexul-4-ose reductase
LGTAKPGLLNGQINQRYSITLGELAEQITAFKNCRTSLISERVGTGLTRALYSTYVSYLPPEQFAYDLPRHGDERGIFVEMLKTHDSGQFSFFTVHPGITRGSHYHHSKTEKFLVVRGVARMRFRHMISGEIIDITVSSDKPQVVDSIPGWVHDITNIGESEAIIMLWANEVFDRQRPDCIPCEV